MMLEMQEFIRQSSLLFTVLAGFAITIVAELITSERSHSRSGSWVVAVFLIGAICLMVSASLATLMLSAPALWQKSTQQVLRAWTLMALVWSLFTHTGVLAVFIGAAGLGWLHSRTVGVIGTVCAAIAALAVWSAFLYMLIRFY